LGVALLVLVFYHAYELFNMKPANALDLKMTGDPKHDPAATTIGVQLAGMLFRVVLLFIMSIAGSLIANKGINLYFSAIQGFRVGLLKQGVVPRPAWVRLLLAIRPR